MNKHTRNSRTPLILVMAASIALLSGCSMFDWIGGGSKKNATANERYDDAPITQETGSIPGDRSNSTYTNEDLQAE